MDELKNIENNYKDDIIIENNYKDICTIETLLIVIYLYIYMIK